MRAAFLGGRYDDALTLLNALNGQLTQSVRDDSRLRYSHLRGICESIVSPLKTKMTAVLEQPNRLPNEEELTAWLSDSTLTSDARAWIRHLIACGKGLKGISSGSPLQLLPQADLPGWIQQRGSWRAESDSIRVDTGFAGHLAAWAVPVGETFKLEGSVKIKSSSNGVWQAGVAFGRKLTVNNSGWGLVRFTPQNGGVQAQLSQAFCFGTSGPRIATVKPDAFEFCVSIDHGRCTVLIDGKTALDSLEIPECVVMDKGTRVGLAGYMNDNTTSLIYCPVTEKS